MSGGLRARKVAGRSIGDTTMTKATAQKVAALVRQIAQAKHLSTHEVAEQAGISFASLCRLLYENHLTHYTLARLKQWALKHTTK